MMKNVMVMNNSATYGFGVCTDDYSQVYIPASILRNFPLAEGNNYMMNLEKNTRNENGKVPWFATFAKVDERDPVDDTVVELDDDEWEPAETICVTDAILSIMMDDDIYLSSEIAALVSEEYSVTATSADISVRLNQLHEKGLIAKASVNQSPSEKRAKYALWALNLNAFKRLCIS